MKRLVLAVFFAISVLFVSAQAKIEFKENSHDFGSIKEDGGAATVVFEYTNTGDTPLILQNVKASCGCTTPEYSKEPVAPGKKGEIKVSYNPQNRPGSFRKSVNVVSNAQPPSMVLYISGSVEQREKTVDEIYPRVMGKLRFKTNYLSFGEITNKETKFSEVEFINTSDKAVKIAVHRAPGHFNAKITPETIKPGETGKLVVEFDAAKKNAYGYVSDRLYLTIDDVSDNTYNVGTSATIKEDFANLSPAELAKAPVIGFDTKVFDFGTIKEGDKVSHDFMLTNSGKSDLIIRNLRTTCGCTTAKNPGVVKAGETTDIAVTFNSRGKRGRQNKSITIITNDPNNSTVVLRMIGSVESK